MKSKRHVLFLSILVLILLIIPSVLLVKFQYHDEISETQSQSYGSNIDQNTPYHYYYPESTLSLLNNEVYPGDNISTPSRSSQNSGIGPEMITYDTVNHEVYISSGEGFGFAYIFVVNPSNDSLVAQIPMTSFEGGGVVYDPTNNELYVAITPGIGYVGNVLVINPLNNTIVKKINIGAPVFGEVFLPDTNQIMVAQEEANKVTVINCSTNSIFRNITIDPRNYYQAMPFELTYDASKNVIYATMYDENNVSLISPINYTVFGNISVGEEPRGILYDPLSSELFVSNWDTISVINTTNNSIVRTIDGLGEWGEPAYFTLDPETNQIYFTGQGYGNVWVIDPKENQIVANISVGSTPMGVSYVPLNGEVFVANYLQTSISIIKPISSRQPVYPIPIYERGLAQKQIWYANQSGNISSGPIDRDTYIAFLANGTYTLNLNGPSGYFYMKSLEITVTGASSSVNVVFSKIMNSEIVSAAGAVTALVLVATYTANNVRRKKK